MSRVPRNQTECPAFLENYIIFARRQDTDYKYTAVYYTRGSHRQRLYFYLFNAATPASSINTATDCCECELHVYTSCRSFSCFPANMFIAEYVIYRIDTRLRSRPSLPVSLPLPLSSLSPLSPIRPCLLPSLPRITRLRSG